MAHHSSFSRRRFLQSSALLAGSLWGAPRLFGAAPGNAFAKHVAARIVSAPEVPLPAGKREPFGWKTAAVGATPLVLAWPDLPPEAKPTALRITVGLDVRDAKLIEACLPNSGRVHGTFDVRFGCLFQVFEIPLALADAADLRREGIALRLTKGAELRVFTEGEGFLGGVSQANKSGEDLQRGTYRVIYQMGMGLMAQLIAALEAKA